MRNIQIKDFSFQRLRLRTRSVQINPPGCSNTPIGEPPLRGYQGKITSGFRALSVCDQNLNFPAGDRGRSRRHPRYAEGKPPIGGCAPAAVSCYFDKKAPPLQYPLKGEFRTLRVWPRLSYTNFVSGCPEMDLNHRPIDFQSIASTAELSGLAGFAPFQASLPCQGLSSRSKFPYGGSGVKPPIGWLCSDRRL